MPDREPVTKTVKASEARQQWSALINQVFRRETRIIVEKSGIPVAAIVSADDLKRIREALNAARRRSRLWMRPAKPSRTYPTTNWNAK